MPRPASVQSQDSLLGRDPVSRLGQRRAHSCSPSRTPLPPHNLHLVWSWGPVGGHTLRFVTVFLGLIECWKVLLTSIFSVTPFLRPAGLSWRSPAFCLRPLAPFRCWRSSSPGPWVVKNNLGHVEFCLCADRTPSLQPKVPLHCHLYHVPDEHRGASWSSRSSGEGEASGFSVGLWRKAWGPSRRRGPCAWRPDQAAQGLLEMRRLWLRRACAAPFDPGDGPRGPRQHPSLSSSLSPISPSRLLPAVLLGSSLPGGPWSVCTGAKPGPWMCQGRVQLGNRLSQTVARGGQHWAGGRRWGVSSHPRTPGLSLTGFLPGPQSPHL